MHICVQCILNKSSLCTTHMALAYYIYCICHCLWAREKNSISCCFGGGCDYLTIHRTESKAWFIVAVFYACQKIRRDNLAPVTPHYSRQWNTRDSCVTPLWSKHKGRAFGAVQAGYGYYCHTATECCGAPQVACEIKKDIKKTNNQHINCCVAQIGDVTFKWLVVGKIGLQCLKVFQGTAQKPVWLSNFRMCSKKVLPILQT